MLRHVSIIIRELSVPCKNYIIKNIKSFNINNLSVCVGWCTDQVTLRSARCKEKDKKKKKRSSLFKLFTCSTLVVSFRYFWAAYKS